MSFTYNITTNIGKVRFKIADKTASSYLVEDDEIQEYLTLNDNNVNLAAYEIALALSAHYSSVAEKRKIGELYLDTRDIADKYRKLADNLKKSYRTTASVYCGGISQSDKDTYEEDSDRVKPKFTKGMHDYKTTNYDDWDDS